MEALYQLSYSPVKDVVRYRPTLPGRNEVAGVRGEFRQGSAVSATGSHAIRGTSRYNRSIS
jgi:hypothetical protein